MRLLIALLSLLALNQHLVSFSFYLILLFPSLKAIIKITITTGPVYRHMWMFVFTHCARLLLFFLSCVCLFHDTCSFSSCTFHFIYLFIYVYLLQCKYLCTYICMYLNILSLKVLFIIFLVNILASQKLKSFLVFSQSRQSYQIKRTQYAILYLRQRCRLVKLFDNIFVCFDRYLQFVYFNTLECKQEKPKSCEYSCNSFINTD